jgi:hypothetical protein
VRRRAEPPRSVPEGKAATPVQEDSIAKELPMGEHLLRIDIQDLATVRVTYKSCQTTTEVPYQNVGGVLAYGKCKHCNNQIHNQDVNPLQQLSRAIDILSNLEHQVAVEFYVPLDPKT